MRTAPVARGREPRQALAEILSPHGLTYEVGPMGRLFIVPKAGSTSSVQGRVLERGGRAPLGGVRILASGTSAQTFSGADGTFELKAVPIGPGVIEAHEPGYVVTKLTVDVPFGEAAELLIELDVGILAIDEIVVTPNRVSLLRDEPVAGLGLEKEDPDVLERCLTGYGNSYLWTSYQSILADRIFVDGAVCVGRVDRDRQGREIEQTDETDNPGFHLVDRRQLDVAALKQNWHFQLRDDQYLRWGFEARRLVAEYDYTNSRELDDPLADIRVEPRTGTRSFAQPFEGKQYSAYFSDRRRPTDSLTVELGMRYDETSLTDDRDLSPRFNLVQALGQSSNLRLAWGHFFQSQRPYELQVADGVTALSKAERTEQRVIGFERAFSPAVGGDYLLRIEAYERLIRDPRSRYENIFEPISIFPEIEPDRVLFAPQWSHAYGLELFLQGRHTGSIGG